MPKQTFFNLPEDKKEKIIRAARKEFSRVSLYEASISNIIKEAEIPRGSFYQYFDNKEDVFFLVLENIREVIESKFKYFLNQTKGDLIEAFIFHNEYLLQSFIHAEDRNFFKNTFLNMNHKMSQTLAPDFKEERKGEKIKEIIEQIDTSKLKITKSDDVLIIFKILKNLTMSNLVESFAKQLAVEDSVKAYNKQIELIKKGIFKEINEENSKE